MTAIEYTQKIIETAVAKRGARIVSFFYNGKPRNATIGFDSDGQGLGRRVWGRHVSPAIVEHRGKLYLSAKTNNETGASKHAYKAFALDQISGLKCR